ncbi:P-loop containing nucleoside triphosphate hydrolase [Phytophthora cactorum]|nr:P-loop containing nucleoside triphosphate hydrolase [Phytophthora cactorum]
MMLPVKLITKESELQSFLDKNENTFTPSERQLSSEHQSDANQKEPDQVVAIVISSDVPSEVAVVLVLASLSKNRIITGLKALLSDPTSDATSNEYALKTRMNPWISEEWASKPLSEKLQRSLAQTAKLQVYGDDKRSMELAVINEGHPASWFDPAADNQPRSLECLISSDGGAPAIELPTLELQCELDSLLDLNPSSYRDAIREMHIGDDNRAGIDRQLHRISVSAVKPTKVYGLTMRVGRALRNAACVLTDLLLSDRHADKSVLVLGHPGSGKTTLIRDVARCVSETMENVCIIDTSNEIGGDGLVPHECVGWARRIMVPSLEAQAGVMVECVQNHTVETLIVDEIGRKAEVLAASTVRQRGPRLIASAHGDFRALIKNPYLKGLVGGSQQVTVGDAAAKSSNKGKLQTQRASNPIFDVIVELDHVVRGRCRIIWDVAKAVVSVLECNGYSFETRRWDASTQGVQVTDEVMADEESDVVLVLTEAFLNHDKD